MVILGGHRLTTLRKGDPRRVHVGFVLRKDEHDEYVAREVALRSPKQVATLRKQAMRDMHDIQGTDNQELDNEPELLRTEEQFEKALLQS